MSQPNDYLDPEWVISTEMPNGGAWLVGFVFETREQGERTMRAIAELYNGAARLVHVFNDGRQSDDQA